MNGFFFTFILSLLYAFLLFGIKYLYSKHIHIGYITTCLIYSFFLTQATFYGDHLRVSFSEYTLSYRMIAFILFFVLLTSALSLLLDKYIHKAYLNRPHLHAFFIFLFSIYPLILYSAYMSTISYNILEYRFVSNITQVSTPLIFITPFIFIVSVLKNNDEA